MKASTLIRAALCAGAFTLYAAIQANAQETLPEITITEARYKYLNSVKPEEAAQPVGMLQQYAASYDLKGAEFYEDEYDNYFVSFVIPTGKILAVYDKDGTLIRTAEHYNNSAVPQNVSKAVAKKYPKWAISSDVYLVTYHKEGAPSQKIYKLVLQDGSKHMRVKINDQGQFL